MAYRIQFAPDADAARRAMPTARRTTFDREIRSTLGTDPYGHGSTARGEKDRREIVIAGAIVIYYVSQAVAMVTAVTIISV